MMRSAVSRVIIPSISILQKTNSWEQFCYKPVFRAYAIQKRLFSSDDVNPKRNTNKLEKENGLPVPDWESMTLQPLKKDFYTPHKDVTKRTDEEIKLYRLKHDVIVSCPAGLKIPRPVQHITEANFPDHINEVLVRNGLQTPGITPAQGWPILMSGFNLVGIGENAPYKILTYMLPALIHIKNQPPLQRGDGPIMLVLAPNKSIGQEIKVVADTYGISTHIQSACIFDDGSKSAQARDLQTSRQIMIGTPRRVLHFLQRNVINLKRTTYLVLDEIDGMLEKGFESQIHQIMEQIRPDRQISIWSTFWSKEVAMWTEKALQKNYIRMDVGSFSVTPNSKIEELDDEKR